MKTPLSLQWLRWVLLSLVALSLGASAFRTWIRPGHEAVSLSLDADVGLPGDGLVVVNFHGTTRCRSCLAIGEQSRLAVESGRREGWLPATTEWRAIDIDVPGREDFVSRYQLVSSTVVVLRRAGGRDVEWKRLDDVWDYISDPARMSEFLRGEIARVGGAAGP